jgi:hypothetical protein
MGSGHQDGLVKEMDPDAVNREEGRGLAIDDTVSWFSNFSLFKTSGSELPELGHGQA